MKLIPPEKVYIKKSTIPNGGRGVFAKSDIKKGEIIEVAPALILEFSEFIDSYWNLLFEYYFWLDDYVVLGLGYGSLYNHSAAPNCRYEISKEDKTITFTATRDISKDEEIYFDYKQDSKSDLPLWFERDIIPK